LVGGGLVSTIDDYAKFTTCLLNDCEIIGKANSHAERGALRGDVKRLIKPELMKLLITNQLPNNSTMNGPNDGCGFSLGSMSVLLNPQLMRSSDLSSVGK
jgi:hypothetical protein